ncbi:hypothetical protein C8R43DRAFT_601033 [Mycena crocata]|nr:hypothetical protein C8R43DRAFT_601033 [Mycena crocata]
MAHPHSTQPPLQPQESMIGPPPSFYENQWEYPQQHPQGHHQQQQHQLHHGQHGGGFDFAYPAPGTSYDDLLAQFAQYPPQGQQQHVQYQQYEQAPPQNTSNPGTSPSNGHNGAPSTSAPPNPKRKRTSAKKAAAPAPAPPASNSNGYSDNSDSEDGFGGFGGGAGISVGMGGLGVRSKGARLPGACTHCKKLKMKCDFGPGGDGGVGRDPADNTCRRCRAGGHVCIVEGRKPRSAPKQTCGLFLHFLSLRGSDQIGGAADRQRAGRNGNASGCCSVLACAWAARFGREWEWEWESVVLRAWNGYTRAKWGRLGIGTCRTYEYI